MKTILIIGIGAGDPDYITVQAIKALNRVDVFFLMDKGPAKQKLRALREELCRRHIKDRAYRFAEAKSPPRDTAPGRRSTPRAGSPRRSFATVRAFPGCRARKTSTVRQRPGPCAARGPGWIGSWPRAEGPGPRGGCS